MTDFSIIETAVTIRMYISVTAVSSGLKSGSSSYHLGAGHNSLGEGRTESPFQASRGQVLVEYRKGDTTSVSFMLPPMFFQSIISIKNAQVDFILAF